VLNDRNPNRALSGLNRSRAWYSVRNSPLHGRSERHLSNEAEAEKSKAGAIVEIAAKKEKTRSHVGRISVHPNLLLERKR
jgi:hypothetical protein